MAAGNTIPADKIFAREAIVALFIPKPLRLASEVKRVFCRVIQHTRAGYQLNTKFGLISRRHQHRQLNKVDSDMPKITCLTITQANSTQKHSFTKIIKLINQRGPIRAQQRKARGKHTRKKAKKENRDSKDNSRVTKGGDAPRSARTGDVI
jgi:hypothetical protein